MNNLYEYKVDILRIRRVAVLYAFFIIVLIVIGISAFFTGNTLILFINIFFAGCLLYVSKIVVRLFSHRILISDDSICYIFSKNDREEISYDEITIAGFYKKKPDSEKVGHGEGLYVYSEGKDRYFLIGKDFSCYNELYERIRAKCSIHNIKWINIEKSKARTLPQEIGFRL